MDALYSGSRFVGYQKSGKASYPVEIELKHVDLKRSSLCGYLKISGLTDEYPELTTFFEAEIIGDKHSFLTGKWDATEAVDRAHWSQFPSFATYASKFSLPNCAPDFTHSDYLFMRWKEIFLVPDHKVATIAGASFAGFYYICFSKTQASFSGYYYYNKINEKFQSLDLKHVPDRRFAEFTFC